MSPAAAPRPGGSRAAEPPAGVCAVVLAAGEGRRLRPLTEQLPKALCPVGNVALLDRVLARLAALGFDTPDRVAVNACYLGDQVVRHVAGRAHLSVEPDDPLGTSGGVANLRDWIDGRGTLVGNADGYLAHPLLPPGPDIGALLAGWDGETVRLLGQPMTDPTKTGGFSGHRFTGFSLLPWRYLKDLPATPSDLVRTVWRPAEAAGDLEVVPFGGTYLDSGTPGDYLAANLHAAAGANLIAPTATVTGTCQDAVIGGAALVRGVVTRSVVWPGGVVGADERLTEVIRAGGGVTVAAGPAADDSTMSTTLSRGPRHVAG